MADTLSREEIIRMAREAGFQTGVMHDAEGDPSWVLVQPIGNGCIVELQRFADLVSKAICANGKKEKE